MNQDIGVTTRKKTSSRHLNGLAPHLCFDQLYITLCNVRYTNINIIHNIVIGMALQLIGDLQISTPNRNNSFVTVFENIHHFLSNLYRYNIILFTKLHFIIS